MLLFCWFVVTCIWVTSNAANALPTTTASQDPKHIKPTSTDATPAHTILSNTTHLNFAPINNPHLSPTPTDHTPTPPVPSLLRKLNQLAGNVYDGFDFVSSSLGAIETDQSRIFSRQNTSEHAIDVVAKRQSNITDVLDQIMIELSRVKGENKALTFELKSGLAKLATENSVLNVELRERLDNMSTENALLKNRLDDVTTKNQALKQEVALVDTGLTAALDKIPRLNDQLKTEVQTKHVRLNDQVWKEINAIKNTYVPKPVGAPVTFSVASTKTFTPTSLSRVPYETDIYNTGHHFDHLANSFRAPANGVYSFSFSGMAGNGKLVDLRLYTQRPGHGYVAIARAYDYFPAGWGAGAAASVTVELVAGDEVSVWLWGDRLRRGSLAGRFPPSAPTTLFSGTLLQRV